MVRIKGKVEQSRERSSDLGVVAIEKGAIEKRKISYFVLARNLIQH